MSTFKENLTEIIVILGINESGPKTLVPIAFTVGEYENAAGENLGTLTIMAYAAEKDLTVADTLALFSEFVEAVTKNPKGGDHPNIRELMGHPSDTPIKSIVTFKGNPIEVKSRLRSDVGTCEFALSSHPEPLLANLDDLPRY